MRRPALTYANVMSTLGVFIALGGTSYAVTKLPKNSVGTDQLRAAAVTKDKLASGVSMSGPRGPRGEQGPSGSTGPAGPVDVIVRRREEYVTFSPQADTSIEVARATLPAGKWVVQAIAAVISSDLNPQAFRCYLLFDGAQWGLDEASELGSKKTQGEVLTVVGTSDATKPVTVTMRCSHGLTLVQDPERSYPSRVERVRLVATRATSLDVADL